MSSKSLLPIFLLCLASIPVAQQTQQPRPPMPAPSITPPVTDENDASVQLKHEMEKKAAKERIAALKSDTDKLVKLSLELKTSVDKSDENVLSLDVIRKAEEIEKLAKSVREKMKGPN